MNLFLENSCLKDFSVGLRGTFTLPESATAGSFRWDLNCVLLSCTVVLQISASAASAVWIRSRISCFSLLVCSLGSEIWPSTTVTAHRWLWQSFTDGLICGAPPPSPPHRWFSPPPVLQTGGPSQLPPRMAFIHHRKLAKWGSHTCAWGGIFKHKGGGAKMANC